jgi:hypothetical protein
MVAEWLDLLAAVVVDARAETEWPETTALDSTRFTVESRRAGKPDTRVPALPDNKPASDFASDGAWWDRCGGVCCLRERREP